MDDGFPWWAWLVAAALLLVLLSPVRCSVSIDSRPTDVTNVEHKGK